MYIKNIKLKDFRNYESLSLQFNKNLNLILGDNGQGKTNILEAIYVTSMGKSFRTNRDQEMINFDKPYAKIFVETSKDGYDGSVELVINQNSKKTAKVDGVKINKASELLKNVYIVIFSPEDLKIVKDEPEKRRKFIDRELCQIKPSYFNNLNNYKRVLLQRNSYLKENYVDKNTLDVWDIELAKYGARIISQRNEFISKINEISSMIHFDVTNGLEKLEIKYSPNISYVENIEDQEKLLYKALKENIETDLRMRTTGKGPHKDDLEFFIEAKDKKINVRSFGSQGQQRTTALSLKLAELNIIKNETGEDAILLLDDVMSELDSNRQEYLVKSLSNNQLFITTTEISELIIKEFKGGTRLNVDSGKVEYRDI